MGTLRRGTSHSVQVKHPDADPGWVRRQLPLVLLVTSAVVVLPPVTVALLHPGSSLLAGMAACMLLSLTVAHVLTSLWQRLPRSRDVVFADLLLWGWVRRVRTERRLARADELLAQRGRGPERDPSIVRELERISAMVELRDGYTHRHSLRVTRHSEAIACELGLSEDEIGRIRTAAALHDVGKYETPRSILNKPGRLTAAEYEVIKRHPGRGAELLEGNVGPDIVAMIRHHHERLGGTGYPDGLAGDAIPLGARIIAVADTFDAITSNRAYRNARSHHCALDILREEAGTALDARCVEAFNRYYSGRRGVYWSNLTSGFGLGLFSVRDFALPASLSRALPAIAASAALSVPIVAGGGAGASAASEVPGDRSAGGPADTPALVVAPSPTPTATPAAAPGVAPAPPARRVARTAREVAGERGHGRHQSDRTRPAASAPDQSEGARARDRGRYAGRDRAPDLRPARDRPAPGAGSKDEAPTENAAQEEGKPTGKRGRGRGKDRKPRRQREAPNPESPPGNAAIQLPDPELGPPGQTGSTPAAGAGKPPGRR